MNPRKLATTWLGGCLALLIAAAPALAQSGTVTGVVTQSGTGQPLEGAVVQLEGTPYSAVTAANGRYLLLNVPGGTYTLVVQMIGHATARRQITVTVGETTRADVLLEQQSITLQELVVTGVAEATPKAKLPFTVERVGTDRLPVPHVSAATALQGKVAGVAVVQGSGRPGEPPAFLLRGAKSIQANGRSQEPLYVVDGAIVTSGLVDFDAHDIESIEVIKGAAAASMYGSRAANGVVQIRTKRGRAMETGQIRYNIRSEYGRSELPRKFPLAMRHAFALNADGTKFLTTTGAECEWLECPNVQLAGQKVDTTSSNPNKNRPSAWNSYMVNEWPGQTYDQVERFFTGGEFMSNMISISGRTGSTNFHVSFNNQDNAGIMPGQNGMLRNNFRINLDQTIGDNMSVSATAFYSRSRQDPFQESQGNALFNLTRMPAGVDLLARDESGNLILRPDPFNENPNPLNEMLNEKWVEYRGRFMGAVNLRFSPTTWMDIDGSVSYDRLDARVQDYFPKGYRTIRPDPELNNGYLSRSHSLIEGVTASITGTARWRFNDLGVRFQTRYLYEQEDRLSSNVNSFAFYATDVPTIDNTPRSNRNGSSSQQRTIADGFFTSIDLDWRDRYILQARVRQDGSSRFGADQRRKWYYGVSGAYRISEEEWFSVPGITELKLRYAVGTAGNTPSWAAQYETYSVGPSGISPVTLGNKDLKPEYATEHEAGVDLIAFDRAQLTLTYAKTTVEDQIMSVPLKAYMGFTSQVRNVGTMESTTWEASLDVDLVRRPEFSWSARAIFDRTRSIITKLDVPPFTYGVSGQAFGEIFVAREGEEYGTYYGRKFATSCADLPEGMSCDGFTVNDEGYLVWVGNDPNLGWGDPGPMVGLEQVMWGTPFVGWGKDRVTGEPTQYQPIGNSMPDYSLGFSTTLSWKGFTLYGLVESVQGFDIWNQPLHWSVFQNYAGIMDQTGKPESQWKPLGYYAALYNALMPNSAFVEDGSFTKLRELSLTYRFGASQLAAIPMLRFFDGIAVSLIGRNLYTWTDYRGYDPETGRGGGTTGSAAVARIDGFNYPNFRTWTVAVDVNF